MASRLPLMEAFYTIQGEGFHQGKAAYFIRLAGCDVGCVWCDVKESWDTKDHPESSIREIIKKGLIYPSRLAVVTGGEPLMYDLFELTTELRASGFKTHLETSGVYPVSGSWDWICFSPKKFKSPDPVIYDKADELKIIIYNQSDFNWALDFQSKVNTACKLYLQPEWSKKNKMVPLMIEFIKANPKWGISLQIHKYMNIP